MTLLIGTVSNKSIVLTSDGKSKRNPKTGAGSDSDTLQKIYPLPSIPIALAHHGLNILGGNEVQAAVNNFSNQKTLDLSALSVIEIANELKTYFDKVAQIAVDDPTNQGVVGFWIAGFSAAKARPEFYEIVWPKRPNPKKLSGLIMAGDAKKFISEYLSKRLNQFEPGRVLTYDSEHCKSYHDALYMIAKKRQEKRGESIFGGTQYQLVIDRKDCNWSKRK